MSEQEVQTFGDDLNSAKIAIQLEPGGSFRCPCGKHTFTLDKYASAHWHDMLESTCPNCGQVFYLFSGEVKMAQPEIDWSKLADSIIPFKPQLPRLPVRSKLPAPRASGTGSKPRRKSKGLGRS